MLAEFVQSIVNLTLAARQPRVLAIKNPRALHLLDDDGSVRTVSEPNPLQRDELRSYEELATMAASPVEGRTLFVDRDGMRLFRSDDRREWCYLALRQTRRWQVIERLVSGRAFEPLELVRFLRFEVGGERAEEAARAFRRVDFSRLEQSKVVHEHGRESLGRSVEMAVQQADTLPESIVVSGSVYAVHGLDLLSLFTVPVDVYLDMALKKIELRVAVEQVDQVLEMVESRISHDLAARGVTALRGTPSLPEGR